MVYTDSVANARFKQALQPAGKAKSIPPKKRQGIMPSGFTVAEIAVMILFSDPLSTEKRESFMMISNVSCELIAELCGGGWACF